MRRWRGAATAATLMACAGRCLAGQVIPIVDAGVSAVRFDGFLGSGSAFVAPGFRYDAPNITLAAQGSWLVFESGNSILQGTGAGAWLTPALGPLRAELSGVGGASKYADEPTAGYALGRSRVHLMGRTRGAWLGGSYGRSHGGQTSFPVGELAGAAWGAWSGLGVAAALTWSTAADTAYLDVTGTAHWTATSIAVDGLLGVRAWSEGAGEGVYGEVVVRVPLERRLAVVLAAGRYPADLIRGTLAGRYASVGVRLVPFAGPMKPTSALTDVLRREPRPPDMPPSVTAPRMTVESADGDTRTIRVVAPGAATVELAADFTDWEPLPLLRVTTDTWEIALRVLPGTYRVNVRVDRGAWLVPQGVRLQQDDFGGEVGVLVFW